MFRLKAGRGGHGFCGIKVNVQVICKTRNIIHARVQQLHKPVWTLLCVYGDAAHTGNRVIWEAIKQIVEREGTVCVMGDFNAIAEMHEKYGGNPNFNANNKNFKDFLFETGLIDLGYKGPAYTWTNGQDPATEIFERLDRIVVTASWTQQFPMANVNHLPRVHSDHAPILLRMHGKPLNQSKFKIEKWWFNHEGFKEVCETRWNESENQPWPIRAELLRKGITEWVRTVENPQTRLNQAQTRLLAFQSLHPSIQSREVGNHLLEEYYQAENDLSDYWRQRSRLQWFTEGDRNTSFFHIMATNRKRRNMITHIETETGSVATTDAAIRGEFVTFFKELYKQPPQQRSEEEFGLYFEHANVTEEAVITSVDQELLSRPPTEAEIKEALFQLGPDKAPGPDGITARLLQTSWETFKEGITKAIIQTFQEGKPPHDWLRSQIVLIPKMEEAQRPKDYRSITIGNMMYRLLMKIIANRLQPHMMRIISNSQTAFLKGRNIADNTILIKEVLHSFQDRGYKEKSFALKADITKAFDTVNWRFVVGAMKSIKMPSRLINLICNCMEMSKVTILVNGQGDGFLKPTRGLRQGCPLSPYLFILVMEFLTKHFNESLRDRNIQGIRLAHSAPKITHLMYADDLIIFGEATVAEVRQIKGILDLFGDYSGLVVNPQKSTIWFSGNCEPEAREMIMAEFEAKLAQEQEKYLGILVTQAGGARDLSHKQLLEKVQDKLSGWKANLLSHVGRLTLVKSVLLSLPVYYMSVAKIPTRTVKAVTAIIRKFLWGKLDKERYVSLIGWDKVCMKKEDGGVRSAGHQTLQRSFAPQIGVAVSK